MTQTFEPATEPPAGRPAARPAAHPGTDDLADRYRPGARPVLLTGVQAVARLLAEQHVRDARAGLRTASFVSGYQGSPLAGLDRTLASVPELRGLHDVHLVPGLNEELGATAVWGSQTELPAGRRTHDGVVGLWYGKGPGVDRSGDALRHANLYGAHPRGGVLALAGDDPASKSSTVPCTSERTLASYGLPVLAPRNAEEVVVLGLHAIALSRASGCWVGMKVVSDVADGLFTLDRDVAGLEVRVPRIEWGGRPWRYVQRRMAAPADSLVAEADLVGPRWALVEAYGNENPLDEVVVDPADAWLGIVAPGAQFDAVRQALADLGLDDAGLHRSGIRLLRVGMPWPLSRFPLLRLARGVERILVVEEKSPFVEVQVRDLLYGRAGAPEVVGKRDGEGRPLVPAGGALTADLLAAPLRALLRERVPLAPPAPARAALTLTPLGAARRPHFCSGCPHNRSTVLPEGSLGAGGIGCHTMVTVSPRESSRVTGLTQMGGEGAQWIGQAPFTDVPHLFQNVGDGTFFHSGQLAVQACVAAGVSITFKLLHNGVVAMTGAQEAQGALDVPALTRKLHAEGVARIVVCADEPQRYGRRAEFAPGTLVWHRDRLDEAQRLLREVRGVTVLVYDQACAAEARRLRKRGRLEPRPVRVLIDEAVCEGCGDCGRKSSCLSVQPVETEFGRRTRIDQGSCNTDYSCLDGDCPSFVTVTADPRAVRPRRWPEPPAVPDPPLPEVVGAHDVFLAGVGGTGIVTVNAVLATAALRDGLRSTGLDQTGLSQKAGPVTSHLRLSRGPGDGDGGGGGDGARAANRVGAGHARALLAFDLLVAADPANLAVASPAATVAVASTSRTPTGAMVLDPDVRHPEEEELLARLERSTARLHVLDALAACQALLGTTTVANLLVVGAALQAGALPLRPASVEAAVRLNGVEVEANLAALRWGRVAVADPAAFAAATAPAGRRPLPDGAELLAGSPLAGEVRRLAGIRAAALREHGGPGAAARYLRLVELAQEADRRAGGARFAEAAARALHRFAAYKDEYEVARLLSDRTRRAELLAQVPGATRPVLNLHPPLLRALGVRRKLRLGPAVVPVLAVLARGRVVRGTPLDPFGRTRVRRLERALAAEAEDLVRRLAAELDEAGYERACAALECAELVRGYEEVKLAGARRYRDRRAELGLPLPEDVVRLLG